MIIKSGKKFILWSSDGSKKLGEFDSREAAENREKQIKFFKALESHPEIGKKLRKKFK